MRIVYFSRILLALLAIAFVAYGSFCFQVAETEAAVVTRFGRPVRVMSEPGLHLKLPWPFENIARIDSRLQLLQGRLSEALTEDKRNVILPFFIVWRIEEPLAWLRSTQGNLATFQANLDSIATSARNATLGRYPFNQLVSVSPGEVRLDDLEAEIGAVVASQAESTFGVKIEAVGINQLALPASNTPFMFDRMRAERAQYAAAFRAEGQREAEDIRTAASVEKTALLAEARQFAAQKRGEAEAAAARTTAEAYRQDPELFRFLREIEALRVVAGRNVMLVADRKTPPFHLLEAESVAPAKSSKSEAAP